MRRIAALALTLTIALTACSGIDQITGRGDQDSDNGATEVVYELAASPGRDPFTPSVQTATSELIDLPETAALRPGVVQAGNTPGLYGGSGDNAVCDANQLTQFLKANPAKAAAWSTALGIEAVQVAAYVRDLEAVVLTRDTRVSNNGFADGQTTAFQATLEAGTAVFVDHFGVPRVRCACGNPLGEPTPIAGETSAGVVVIVAGPYQAEPPYSEPPTVGNSSSGQAAPVDFCSIYAAMRADLGVGPSSGEDIPTFVARLANWLTQLVDAAESISGFPVDGYNDLIAYRNDTAAGPSATGSTALRDRVEAFLEDYCSDPPPPVEDAVEPGDNGGEPDPGPIPDSNCGSFQFFLTIAAAEGLGLDWEPVGGTYFDQLTNFVADSLDDMLTYEEIGCAGAQAMIAFLEANGYPNPFES